MLVWPWQEPLYFMYTTLFSEVKYFSSKRVDTLPLMPLYKNLSGQLQSIFFISFFYKFVVDFTLHFHWIKHKYHHKILSFLHLILLNNCSANCVNSDLWGITRLSQSHLRNTEWLELKAHLVQPPCNKRGHCQQN